MSREFKIGADPELFVFDNVAEQFISAHNIFPGTKYEPHPIGVVGAIQVDGTAFEFNIAPAVTSGEFIRNINSVLSFARVHLRKHDTNLEFKTEPTAIYPQDYFDALPQHSKELGCEPDFDAWSGRVNPKPSTKKPMRTGSGHVHIGWTFGEDCDDPGHIFDCHSTVKQLDAALFIPSLLWDFDKSRRELYGKMGTYRPKHYGVEYRVLSNKWVGSRDLQEFVFDTSKAAAELLDNDVRLWEDKEVKQMLTTLQMGEDIPNDVLLNTVSRLTDDFGLPEYPVDWQD